MSSSLLPVMEQFYTIQGEGAHSGKPAYFIRLGGCDVGCVWCDVKESWDADKHPSVSVATIMERMGDIPAQLVVITGGEPLMYDVSVLTQALQKNGYATHLETSGAYPLTGSWDWICCSPKKFKAPLPEVLSVANELKVVIYNKHDFEWALQFVPDVPKHCRLFLQPEWSRSEVMMPLIVDFVRQHPSWEVSLQTHKYLNIP